jgi:glutathione S-transferase
MKLLYVPASPFARKARVVALEKGVASRIELRLANPWPEPVAITPYSPLGKIPVLVLDDGACLFDSPVICEYLDSLAKSPCLIPESGPARWRVLRRQALADGLLEAAVNIVMEHRRPESERSSAMLARFHAAVRRCLAQCRDELEDPAACFDLGQIALACALGYVEFRLGPFGVALEDATLTNWWSEVKDRPSLRDTEPVLV